MQFLGGATVNFLEVSETSPSKQIRQATSANKRYAVFCKRIFFRRYVASFDFCDFAQFDRFTFPDKLGFARFASIF